MDEKKNKIIKSIAIILVTMIVNFGLYDFYIIPKYKDAVGIKENYKKKMERIALINKNRENINNIRKSNEVIKTNIDNINKLIPNKIDTAALSYEFYDSCVKYEITGEEIRFELPQYGNTSEQLKRLTISLKVSGANDKIASYIKNIDTITTRKVNLKSLSLFYQDENNISLDIVLYQYIQK